MKRISLTTLAVLLATVLAMAQVTIGSLKTPIEGALLMLDDGTTDASGGNSKKGLGLPRVNLQAYDKLKMGATATEYSDKTEYAGLVVYNTNSAFNKCDAASIPSGLHVWDGAKWEGIGTEKHYTPTPPDLSSSLYHPNAYMVEAGSPGSVAIPVGKAFEVWEFWASEQGGKKLVSTPFTDYLSVTIVWEEALGTGDNDIIDTPTLSTTSLDKTATITVPTTGNPGNAVVSLSDGTGVRWSWHIWVTATPATTTTTTTTTTVFNGLTWMDRNLGATSAEVGNDGAIGLHYQWGRHMPLPGYTKFALTNNITSILVSATAFDTALANDGNSPMGANTLAYTIAHPLAFIKSGTTSTDWYSATDAQWDTRWAEKITDIECPAITYDVPSITNPCPAGWKVPVFTNDHQDSPWAGLVSPKSWNMGYNWPTSVGYYPAAGYRVRSNGNLNFGGYNGYYWSASPNIKNAHNQGFFEGEVQEWPGNRASGFSVRCVQE